MLVLVFTLSCRSAVKETGEFDSTLHDHRHFECLRSIFACTDFAVRESTMC